MKILGARVDWLEIAFRVELDPELVAALKERGKVARAHGRASFRWGVMVPDDPCDVIGRGKLARLGPVKAQWPNEEHVTKAERRSLLWGELRYSRKDRCWLITNEPYFRLAIDEHAPGAPEEGGGPGFTVVIAWYAQELANRGVELALRESAAIAALCGDVHETRLRRFDLAADVLGFSIDESDVRKLVKRPRAKWAKHYEDDAWNARTGEARGEDAELSTHAVRSGPTMADRPVKLTGISVGTGGAVMMRIYDKRAELAGDPDRRMLEEERWIRAGCGPIASDAPVSRVEFQIRGEAIKELGLRDPDCVLETLRDAKGRASGQVVSVVKDEATGKMREATFVDWIDRVWSTCLEWAKLVSGQRTVATLSGRRKRIWIEDERWTLLRAVRFTDKSAAPIRRYRPRAEASAAMALGVTLSQAGREGLLVEWDEDPAAYAGLINPIVMLRQRLRALKNDEVERILEWLIPKWGGEVGALVHLATRANASRARFGRPGLVAKPLRGAREMARRDHADGSVSWVCRKWTTGLVAGAA